MREVPIDAATLSHLLKTGWTRSAVRHAVATATLTRARRSVFRPTTQLRTVEQAHLAAAVAAVQSCPRASISHVSASLFFGLPSLGPPGRPCLTVPAGTALRHVSAVHLHRATLTAADLIVVGSVRTTSVARAIVDLARERGVDAGVVAADAAMSRQLTTPEALREVLDRCTGWPGRARAKQAVELADGSAESPLESLSRLRMRTHGIPAPQPQVNVRDRAGRFVGRVDFYWAQFGVVGEADGLGKYVSPADLRAEKLRQERLEGCGLRVVRWGWDDLSRFDLVAARLLRAFRQAGFAPDEVAS